MLNNCGSRYSNMYCVGVAYTGKPYYHLLPATLLFQFSLRGPFYIVAVWAFSYMTTAVWELKMQYAEMHYRFSKGHPNHRCVDFLYAVFMKNSIMLTHFTLDCYISAMHRLSNFKDNGGLSSFVCASDSAEFINALQQNVHQHKIRFRVSFCRHPLVVYSFRGTSRAGDRRSDSQLL